MAATPSPKPIVLDPEGDGLLYFPYPPSNAAFRISTKVLSSASSVLAELYRSASTVSLTDVDDAKAIAVVLKILHFIDPRIPEESVTPENVASIAKLSLKWKCNRALGSYPRLWLSILQNSRTTDEYEPWKCWLVIARAFGGSELTADCIVNQQVSSLWRETGYDELEALRLCLDPHIVDALQVKRIQAITFIGRATGECLKFIYTQSTLCKAQTPSARCDSLLLGSFVRNILESILKPIPKDPFGAVTVNSLLGESGIRKPGILGLEEHPACKSVAVALQVRLSNAVEGCVDSLDHDVRDALRQMLAAPAQPQVPVEPKARSPARPPPPAPVPAPETPRQVPSGLLTAKAHPSTLEKLGKLLKKRDPPPNPRTPEDVLTPVPPPPPPPLPSSPPTTTTLSQPPPSQELTGEGSCPVGSDRPESFASGGASGATAENCRVFVGPPPVQVGPVVRSGSADGLRTKKTLAGVEKEVKVEGNEGNEEEEEGDGDDDAKGDMKVDDVKEGVMKRDEKKGEEKGEARDHEKSVKKKESHLSFGPKGLERDRMTPDVSTAANPAREGTPSKESKPANKVTAVAGNCAETESVAPETPWTKEEQRQEKEIKENEGSKENEEGEEGENGGKGLDLEAAKRCQERGVGPLGPAEGAGTGGAAAGAQRRNGASGCVKALEEANAPKDTPAATPRTIVENTPVPVGEVLESTVPAGSAGSQSPGSITPAANSTPQRSPGMATRRSLNPLAPPFDLGASPSKSAEGNPMLLGQKESCQGSPTPTGKDGPAASPSNPTEANPMLGQKESRHPAARENAWTPELRLLMLARLGNPDTKNMVKTLRKKYRQLGSRVILSIMHHNNWDPESAEQDILTRLAKN